MPLLVLCYYYLSASPTAGIRVRFLSLLVIYVLTLLGATPPKAKKAKLFFLYDSMYLGENQGMYFHAPPY